ncbi:MAG: class I adenylate-forming enzyme family protein [Candidatus Dormibacteria bacterium]
MSEAAYDAGAFRQVFEANFTYLAGFRRNVHRYADHLALLDPESGRTWTYRELASAVDQLADGLVALGLGPGQVVTYQLTNRFEFAALYLATQVCGAIGSPINYRLSPGETGYILDDSQPRLYFFDASCAETARAALEICRKRPETVVGVGPLESAALPPGTRTFEDVVEAGRGGAFSLGRSNPWASGKPGAAYRETTRLYTSGTTGLPKGVPLSSLVEVLTAHDVIMHFPMSPEDRTLNMTPWFHRGGLYSGGPNPAFYVGAAVVPLARFEPETCLDYVERYQLTYLIGSPTTLTMLATSQEARRRDLTSLRGIVTMGAPLERAACLRFQETLTPRIFNGYGTSEAFWNTFLRPSDLPDHAGSAGRACTDDDVAVVRLDAQGRVAPETLAARDSTEVGEVAVRSPKCGYAYLHAGDEQSATFRDGWVFIGDLGTWDQDEYVTIVGRKDDMIISGGENVHPIQVEEVLNQHPAVADSVVVGLPDTRWGEVVVAYVTAKDAVAASELDRHCQDHAMLANFKRPRAYRFVDSLPFTATGKKMHYQVRQQATDDQAGGLLEWL